MHKMKIKRGQLYMCKNDRFIVPFQEQISTLME